MSVLAQRTYRINVSGGLGAQRPNIAWRKTFVGMAGTASQVQGAFLDYPGSLEQFWEPDTNDGIACVPATSASSVVNLTALTGADMVCDFDARFRFIGTLNAYTGTLSASPWFPYIFVQNLKFPYQSSSLSMQAMDGHLTWLTNLLVKNNRGAYQSTPYIGQVPIVSTGYSVQANIVSAANYAWAPSVQKTFEFDLRVSPALFLNRFYDATADGKMGLYTDVYVSPFLMASTGRNVIPSVQTYPVVGATVDVAAGVQTGTLTTAPTWTDNGSLLWIRRHGFRQPVNTANMPPLFNWAHQWYVQRNSFAGGARIQIPIPTEGQLLRIVCRLFDPTLNAGIGGPIPINNAAGGITGGGTPFRLSYGPGINKFADTPKSMQDRVFRQHGFVPTEGVIIWDLVADSSSNLDAINTYNTAAPVITLDFTGSTPGAGSYVDTAMEFLTLVGS